MEDLKRCTKCGNEYPRTVEYFHRQKANKDGFYSLCKKCKKKYREENKDRISEREKKYKQENRDKISEYHKKYREENPEIYMLAWQRRRARKKQLPHTLTKTEWDEIKGLFNHSCAYCGMSELRHKRLYNQQLHQEHVQPVSEGGGYVYNNIIPACKSCNSSKSTSDLREWYRQQPFYSIEKETLIFYHFLEMELPEYDTDEETEVTKCI